MEEYILLILAIKNSEDSWLLKTTTRAVTATKLKKDKLKNKKTEIIILDHHEIPPQEDIPDNVTMIHPHLFNAREELASSALCYLFAKTLDEENKDLATLAIIGMIGDMLEKHKDKTYSKILKDAEVTIKTGLLLYPATRPIDRVLENSFGFYIPEVTGSYKGVLDLLREAGLEKSSKGYKSLAELTDEEMSNLTTAIMLKKTDNSTPKESDSIGNIYLINFFNRLEDAREISALINACSRMDPPEIALGFCLENKALKEQAEKIAQILISNKMIREGSNSLETKK